MLPTPLLISMILSMPALSAALPVPAPAAAKKQSHLRIVEAEPINSLEAFLKVDVDEPANVEDDSIYSEATQANPDWDAVYRARAKRALAGQSAPQQSKHKKAKRSIGATAKVANLNLINKAAAASTSALATQITTESISISRASASAEPSTTSAAPASSATAREFNYGPVRGKNAQQTVNSVINSLHSAWESNASSATAAPVTTSTVSVTATATVDSFSILAEPTVSASADPYNGGETTSTGWEISGEHTGSAMYMNGGTGACGVQFATEAPVVALSWALFKHFPGATADPVNSPLCGRQVQVEYNGVTVVAQVADAHQSAMSDVILTGTLFEKLAPLEQGLIEKVNWSFI